MKRIMVFTFLIAVFSFSMMGQANAATTWDLANNFSLTSNPNGDWTYGAYSGTTFVAYTGSESNVLGTLDIWRETGTADPNIVKNIGVADYSIYNITFHAGKVTFGPTLGPAVARWRAPSAGTFKVVASFATVQTINSIPNAYIFVGTTQTSLGAVPAFGDTVGYNEVLSLNLGDTIDFVVNANGSTKTTEVSATITQMVVFSCLGFEPPAANGTIKVKKNRVIPFKAELMEDGYPIVGGEIFTPPVIMVNYTPEGGSAMDVTLEALSAGQGTDGNQFFFDYSGKWQYNLQTTRYSAPGTYAVTIVSGDSDEYIITPACTARFMIE